MFLVSASCLDLDRLAYVFSTATDREGLFENILRCSKLNIVYMLVQLSICAQGKVFMKPLYCKYSFGGEILWITIYMPVHYALWKKLQGSV